MRDPIRLPRVFGLMNIKYQFKEHVTVFHTVPHNIFFTWFWFNVFEFEQLDID